MAYFLLSVFSGLAAVVVVSVVVVVVGSCVLTT